MRPLNSGPPSVHSSIEIVQYVQQILLLCNTILKTTPTQHQLNANVNLTTTTKPQQQHKLNHNTINLQTPNHRQPQEQVVPTQVHARELQAAWLDGECDCHLLVLITYYFLSLIIYYQLSSIITYHLLFIIIYYQLSSISYYHLLAFITYYLLSLYILPPTTSYRFLSPIPSPITTYLVSLAITFCLLLQHLFFVLGFSLTKIDSTTNQMKI